MSLIGEVLLKSYLCVLPRKPRERAQSPREYQRWQYQTSPAMFATLPNFDFRGKRVLELGCGLGGRSLWLAANGAREVVGIDINAAEIRHATSLSTQIHPGANVRFCVCQENDRLPAVGQFDYVLLLDSLEHVLSPSRILRLASTYAKPGGLVYFTTIGWYHHAGSHTGIPFASLLFSDETIANVIRWRLTRPGYQPTMWDSDPPVARWEGICDLRDQPGEYLNKITIRQIRRVMKYAPFRRRRLVVLGFRNAKLARLNPLRHVPILNEVFHSGVVGVLEAGPAEAARPLEAAS